MTTPPPTTTSSSTTASRGVKVVEDQMVVVWNIEGVMVVEDQMVEGTAWAVEDQDDRDLIAVER